MGLGGSVPQSRGVPKQPTTGSLSIKRLASFNTAADISQLTDMAPCSMYGAKGGRHIYAVCTISDWQRITRRWPCSFPPCLISREDPKFQTHFGGGKVTGFSKLIFLGGKVKVLYSVARRTSRRAAAIYYRAPHQGCSCRVLRGMGVGQVRGTFWVWARDRAAEGCASLGAVWPRRWRLL